MTSSAPLSPAAKNDIDYVFDAIVGGHGYWQWRTFSFICIFFISNDVSVLLHLFAAHKPAHRCHISVCESSTTKGTSMSPNWTVFSIPSDHRVKEFLTDEGEYDPCYRYETFSDDGPCRESNFDSNATVACEEYVYNRNVFPETLTTKYDLVCENDWQRRFIGTTMMVGFLLGSLIGGHIVDALGRKWTIFLAKMIAFPCILLSGFAPNFEVYALLKLVYSACTPLTWVSCNACCVELFDRQHREIVSVIKESTWMCGQLLLLCLAYFFRHWSQLHIAASVVTGLPLLLWTLMPESPRWLAQNGKIVQAANLVESIAKSNGRVLTEDQRQEIRAIMVYIKRESQTEKEKSLSPKDMFCKGYRSTSMILILAWVCVNVGSYTLSLNSTKLSGDLFINFALGALSTIPGLPVQYVLLRYVKRKFALGLCLSVLALSMLTMAFIPKDYTYSVLLLYLFGRSFTGICFSSVWLLTAELYPTNLRGQAMGLCSAVARAFGLCCPFVANLSVWWKPLPMVALGLPTLFAGILVVLNLPDTLRAQLPQNLKDGLELNKTNEEKTTC